MKALAPILLLLVGQLLQAQSFTNKTNAIILDYTQPVPVTTLPVIVWTTPRAESSVSGDESITLEATITSDVILREVRLVITNGGESA